MQDYVCACLNCEKKITGREEVKILFSKRILICFLPRRKKRGSLWWFPDYTVVRELNRRILWHHSNVVLKLIKAFHFLCLSYAIANADPSEKRVSPMSLHSGNMPQYKESSTKHDETWGPIGRHPYFRRHPGIIIGCYFGAERILNECWCFDFFWEPKSDRRSCWGLATGAHGALRDATSSSLVC